MYNPLMIKLDFQDTERMNKVLRHRLRNVASGMRNAITLLSKELDDRLTPNEREYFPLLINECNELAGMTDRMNLLFDEFGHGAPGKAGALCEKAVSDARAKYPTTEFKIECSDATAAEAVVCSDQRLTAMLAEALVNAVETRPGGAVVLRCGFENEQLRFSVIDEGAGVESGKEEDVFLPFFTMKPRHIGIGLAFVRKLAGETGAEARLENREGGGCELRILLPRASDTDTVIYGTRRKD